MSAARRAVDGRFLPGESGNPSGSRGRPAKTHCPRNHPYSPQNTIHKINTKGFATRTCRACARIHTNAFYQKHRERLKNRNAEWHRAWQKTESGRRSMVMASRKRVDEMSDSYIAMLLGVPVAKAPPMQLILKRSLVIGKRTQKSYAEKFQETE